MNIEELLQKQRELDTYIVKEKGLGNPYDKKFLEDRKLALQVEMGELANTTRCFKYWSNKGQEKKEIILDEVADVLHFTLSLMNLSNTELSATVEEKEGFIKLMLAMGKADLVKGFNTMFEYAVKGDWEAVLDNLIAIYTVLGFDAEEVEKAYFKKHKENYKRQQEGY